MLIPKSTSDYSLLRPSVPSDTAVNTAANWPERADLHNPVTYDDNYSIISCSAVIEDENGPVANAGRYSGTPQRDKESLPVSRTASIAPRSTLHSYEKRLFQSNEPIALILLEAFKNSAVAPDDPATSEISNDKYDTADEGPLTASKQLPHKKPARNPSINKPPTYGPPPNGIPWIWLVVLKVLLIIVFVFALGSLEWYLICHKSQTGFLDTAMSWDGAKSWNGTTSWNETIGGK